MRISEDLTHYSIGLHPADDPKGCPQKRQSWAMRFFHPIVPVQQSSISLACGCLKLPFALLAIFEGQLPANPAGCKSRGVLSATRPREKQAPASRHTEHEGADALSIAFGPAAYHRNPLSKLRRAKPSTICPGQGEFCKVAWAQAQVAAIQVQTGREPPD